MDHASGLRQGRKAGTRPPRARPDDVAYRAACRRHGAEFVALPENLRPLRPDRLPSGAVGRLKASVFRFPDGSARMVLAPRPAELDALAAWAGRAGALVTTPRRMEAALRQSIATRVIRGTTALLARREPDLSAGLHPSMTARWILATVLIALPAGLLLSGGLLLWVITTATAAAFLTLTAIRIQAALAAPLPKPEPEPLAADDLPTYTVLVPLRHEAAMVPGLVRRLEELDYPPSRLEIRLLVEADDRETWTAALAACRRSDFAVMVVPPGSPRTKPRALAYALAFTRGDLVTVFDAEDRPDPDQLRKAAAALVRGPDHLACVQARLEIDRPRTYLQRQFAVEYAALFGAILPWLASEQVPLPLGGTSNHFKREALDYVSGWDPYNVTEDADLGIRLYRFGFTTGTVDSATGEDAPRHWRVWHRQRVRWLKGWMVTWGIHTRRPRQVIREMGWRNWWMMQAYAVSTVFAPLLHPVGFTQLVATVTGLFGPSGNFWLDVLGATVLWSTALGYGAAMLAAWAVLARRGRVSLLSAVPWLPIYWSLISLAGWCAVIDLIRRPHHWAKTPHEPHSGPG